MTRKDYEALAQAIHGALNWDGGNPWASSSQYRYTVRVAHNIADMLEQDNPRFDRGRFLKACGI